MTTTTAKATTTTITTSAADIIRTATLPGTTLTLPS
jgi:hypothetical protein